MLHKLPTPLEEPLTLCVDFASLRETSHWKEEFRAKDAKVDRYYYPLDHHSSCREWPLIDDNGKLNEEKLQDPVVLKIRLEAR